MGTRKRHAAAAARAALAGIALVVVVTSCARAPEPARAPLVAAAEPDDPAAGQPVPAPAEPVASGGAHAAELTGGVGNHVVGSFDQLRAAVARVQRQIDDCYTSTAAEGGWRENLMWDLDISDRGTVLRVTPHAAEYWRGNQIVQGVPEAGLGACMQRALGQLVIAPPVRAGWVRLRFES
jgi:hypothetical protein